MAIPHLKLPFHIGGRGAADVIEQDSIEEIAQCVQVLVSTRLGERIEIPNYGIPDQVMTVESVARTASLATQIERWEPRARVAVNAAPDDVDELIRILGVKVRPVV